MLNVKCQVEQARSFCSFFFFSPFFFRKRYSTRDKHVRVRREYPDNNGYLITCMSHTFLHLTYFIR